MTTEFTLDYKTIKAVAGIFDDYRDDIIIPTINTIALYAYNAGVSQEVIESEQAVGLLACGLRDMDCPGASGEAKFSPIFELMLAQLSYGR